LHERGESAIGADSTPGPRLRPGPVSRRGSMTDMDCLQGMAEIGVSVGG
jgi:hypothetical protein